MSDTNPSEDFVRLEADAVLNEEQTARAAALAFARATLADEQATLGRTVATLPKRFSTTDLLDLAQWIIDGRDPMATYYEEERRRAGDQ